MAKLKPNGDFKVKEELLTTAVFPRSYTVDQAIEELRQAKACGNFVVILTNGGVRAMQFLEKQEVEVST